MKQAALTLLGYSSFSAVLLLGQAVQANNIPANVPTVNTPINPLYADYVNPFPVFQRSVAAQSTADDCTCQQMGLDPDSDPVGELAIAQLGCDCAGCRNTIVQMAQAETQIQP